MTALASTEESETVNNLTSGSVPVGAQEGTGHGDLRSSLKRGSIWALVGHGGSQILRLAGNLVLWRLLFPEAFGLMAIVNVFMQGLAMFSDIGIGPSIVQNARGDEPLYLNSAWTIQVIRGGLLWCAALVLAIPIAHFYGEPRFANLIPVVALSSIISGFNSTRLFTVTRKLALARLTVVDLTSQATGLLVMILLSWLTRNIWALVLGGLVSSLTRLALSHTYLPGVRNRFCWDPTSIRTLVHFGRWLFFSTLLSFAVMQSDRLIFGKLIPMSLLGVYSIALVWSSFPASILDKIFNSVVFPLLSRVHREGGDFSISFVSLRRPWLMAVGWATSCLIVGGPALVRLLYDNRAESGGWMIQVLACSMWLLALETANSTALLALGRSDWVAIGSGAKLVAMLVCIPIGQLRWGFVGALVGFAGSELFRYVASVVGARAMGVRAFRQDAVLTLLLATACGFGCWVLPQWQATLSLLPIHQVRLVALVQLLGIGVVVGSVWVGPYYWARRRDLLLQSRNSAKV